MQTLRQWTQEMMHRQFLDGLLVGFLCGALVITGIVLFWAQDRSIVRAAKVALYEINGDGRLTLEARGELREAEIDRCLAGVHGAFVKEQIGACAGYDKPSLVLRASTSALLAP